MKKIIIPVLLLIFNLTVKNSKAQEAPKLAYFSVDKSVQKNKEQEQQPKATLTLMDYQPTANAKSQNAAKKSIPVLDPMGTNPPKINAEEKNKQKAHHLDAFFAYVIIMFNK